MGMPLSEQNSDPIEIAIYAAELGTQAPEIDLHNLDINLAKDALGNFLHKEFSGLPRRDIKIVKVIHGRGTGVLQEKIKKFLDSLVAAKKFVVGFRTSANPKETNGVFYVALAPNKK